MKETDAYLLYISSVLKYYFSANRTVNPSTGFQFSLTTTLGFIFHLLAETLYSNPKSYDRHQVARFNQPLSPSAMQDHYFDHVISAIDGISISEPTARRGSVSGIVKEGPYIDK